MGSSITFGDDDRAYFGNGTDLQIYHSGSDSFISDTGTGDLIVTTSQMRIKNAANNATMAVFTEGGKAQLWYNNSQKFETTNTGAVVTGILTATSFSGNLTGNATGLSGTPNISCGTIAGSTGTFSGNLNVAQNIVHTGDTDTKIEFLTNNICFDTAGSERLRITSGGNVGINVTDPDSILETVSPATDGINAHIGGLYNDAGQSAVRRIEFGVKNYRNAIQSQQGSGGDNFSSDNDLLLNPSGGDMGLGTVSPNSYTDQRVFTINGTSYGLSLIHISEPTRLLSIGYSVVWV